MLLNMIPIFVYKSFIYFQSNPIAYFLRKQSVYCISSVFYKITYQFQLCCSINCNVERKIREGCQSMWKSFTSIICINHFFPEWFCVSAKCNSTNLHTRFFSSVKYHHFQNAPRLYEPQRKKKTNKHYHVKNVVYCKLYFDFKDIKMDQGCGSLHR